MKTFNELYELFINELQNQNPNLTDDATGSILDVVGGTVATAVYEIQALTVDEFRKTFFDTANGPEITGGNDDLQDLAVDHFGDQFKRPDASKSSGVVTFTRPNTDFGNFTIPAGTVVKTPANAAGTSQRFETEADVEMTGLSINASAIASVAGVAGNVQANTITQIESTLDDASVTVNNSSAFSGGEEKQNDVEYRETIRTLLQSLKGGTLAAIQAKAQAVAGVEFAKAVEFLVSVIEWDTGTNTPIGDSFSIPRAKVFIADANGNSSQTLIDAVKTALDSVRAAGVKVEVFGVTAITINWDASYTLNPGGPNYAELQTDDTLIVTAMRKYLQDLAVGSSFVRTTAKSAIMAIFGPSGTNDLTNFSTNSPNGDVSVGVAQKAIPGTITTS